VLRRSPTSSSTSPSKELARSASNHRRHRGYLARELSSPSPNCLLPATLRPNRAHQRTQGEPPVLLDPSPFLFRVAAPAMAGRCRCLGAGQAGLCPSRPWPANVASGPSGQWPWVKLTQGVKSSGAFIYFRKIAASI
jgi:hypothetical protein